MSLLKHVFFFLLLFLPVFLSAQELRDEIAIIWSNPSESLKQSNEVMARWLENGRRTEAADHFRARNEGGFGSGFLIEWEGELALITNYHVIAGSQDISVEFQSRNGEQVNIEDCYVVFADPSRDLALISIADQSLIPGSGMTMKTELISEGTEIWAAGYPSLISQPSWQLSIGSVTNQSVHIPERNEINNEYFVQHSAVIDPGSSGGPLLLPGEDGSTVVVGVNSLSVQGRHNTFFAISTESIEEFLEEASGSREMAQADQLEQQLVIFEDLMIQESEYPAVRSLISDELATVFGWEAYLDERRDLEKNERDELDEAVFSLNTIQTFKSILFEKLTNAMKGIESGARETSIQGDKAVVAFTREGEDSLETLWAREYGCWRLVSLKTWEQIIEEKEEEKVSERNPLNYFDYSIGVFGSVGVAFGLSRDVEDIESKIGLDAALGGQLNISRYLGFSFAFEITKIQFSGMRGVTSIDLDLTYIQIPLNAVLMYPFMVSDKAVLVPVLTAGGGVSMATDLDVYQDFNAFWSIGLGLEFLPNIRKYTMFGFEVRYRGYGDTEISYSDSINLSNLSTRILVKWTM